MEHIKGRTLRFVIGLGFVIVLLVVGGVILGVVFTNRGLPRADGSFSVAGIGSKVDIYRDDYGIPYIEAATDADAYYALGFLHAQDRLFQMEMSRRLGQGRLAELVGLKALTLDVWSHTIGFRRIADQMWTKASPSTKAVLTAYSKGVNAFITERHGNLGFEFDALATEPEPWKPQDCLLIGRLMSWEMNFSYWADAAFGDIALSVDSAHLNSLIPGYPSSAPTILGSGAAATPMKTAANSKAMRISHEISSSARNSQALRATYAAVLDFSTQLAAVMGTELPRGGSNAFTLSGAKTKSGKGMLENDIHLQLQAPSRWYLARLHSREGLTVAGFSVPGMPAIISGRNENISWGVTNAMTDESDFFVEKLDSSRRKYMFGNSPKEFVQIIDTISVKDSISTNPPKILRIQIRQTIHGPVVSEIHPYRITQLFFNDQNAGGIPSDTTIFNKGSVVSLMWNGQYALGDEFDGFLSIARAGSISEARQHFASYATPCLNLHLVDVPGNQAYQFIGRLPKRAGSTASLLLPRDGNNPAENWQGFVTGAALPSLTNPASGFITSANNPQVSSFGYPISDLWEPPGRAGRIVQLLQYYPKLDTSEVKSIMTDIVSPYDRQLLLPHLLRLYADPNPSKQGADSSSKHHLDSMKMAWKLDSLRQRGVSDSLIYYTYKQDSIYLAAHNPDSLVPRVLYSKTVALALDYLYNWDGTMSKDQVAPTIHSVFLQRLLQNTFQDELGATRFKEFVYVNNVPMRTIIHLLADSGNVWWDNVNTRYREDRDTILRLSFREALTILYRSFGPDMRTWQWGRLHTLTYKHQFTNAGAAVARLVNIPAGPQSGGPTTVVQATYYLWKPYEMQVGPSMRMIADMSTNSLYGILPTGNGGAIFGDHYKDMLARFQKGDLLEIPLTSNNSSWKRLELVPK